MSKGIGKEVFSFFASGLGVFDFLYSSGSNSGNKRKNNTRSNYSRSNGSNYSKSNYSGLNNIKNKPLKDEKKYIKDALECMRFGGVKNYKIPLTKQNKNIFNIK